MEHRPAFTYPVTKPSMFSEPTRRQQTTAAPTPSSTQSQSVKSSSTQGTENLYGQLPDLRIRVGRLNPNNPFGVRGPQGGVKGKRTRKQRGRGKKRVSKTRKSRRRV